MQISIYYCRYCGHETHEPEQDLGCPECDSVMEFDGHRQAYWMSVAPYSLYREYGGPEEGGWYYDAGSLIIEKTRIFEDPEEARAYLDTLGPDGRIFAERFPPLSIPESRPYYC